MTTITVNFDANKSDRFPVHCKYDGQFNAQPAFISLDLRTGVVDADYSSETGSFPCDVWNRKVLRFSVSSMTNRDEIEELINRFSEVFEKLVALYKEEKYEEITEIEFNLSETFSNEVPDSFIIDDFQEWLMNGGWPEAGSTIRNYVAEIAATNGDGEAWLPEKMTDNEYLKGSILLVWADLLYDGEEIPAHVAKILLSEGTCTDSEWMDELKEFAAA